MAAATIKAINAKIRSNPVSDYFCSTHFWGPASNFGIPIAAVLDTQKDPEIHLLPVCRGVNGREDDECGSYDGTPLLLYTYLEYGTTWLALLGADKKLCNSISGTFTAALTVYSGTFMRYALAVQPKNYLLFACHFVNFNAQLTQGYRWYDYCRGGQDRWAQLRTEAAKVEGKTESIAEAAKTKVAGAVQEAKKTVS
ncbi:hypothetical protein LTR40_000873 [Exophiala xenobiotica]|nr:hypothetical protein LTR40_000873 [Exophiala xenobiotica]